MEKKQLEIRIIVEARETKEGKKFNGYKAVQKDGKLVETKFTRGCKNVPEQSCNILVNTDDVNLATNTLYPTLWVKNVVEIIFNDGSKFSEKNAEQLFDIFG